MNKVDIFIQLNGKFFEVDKIGEIRSRLEELSDLELDHLAALGYKNPMVIFIMVFQTSTQSIAKDYNQF